MKVNIYFYSLLLFIGNIIFVLLYQLALIFASLLAVTLARIEVNQQLDGSMVEIIDDVLDPNPYRGSPIL